MVVTENVLIQKDKRTATYYESKGYILSKVDGSRFSYFNVRTKDIHPKSRVRVDAECSSCSEVREVSFYQYREVCHTCSSKLPVSEETKRKQSNARKGKGKGLNNPSWKGGKNPCITCGVVTSNRVVTQCKSCFLERDQSGENNLAWKHYTEEERSAALKERKGYLARRWGAEVKLLAAHSCDCCLIEDATMHAHHLNNWLDNPELRFDVTNGVCLCQDCHMGFHSIFGKHNNTKQQYKEFKECAQ